MQIRQPKGIRKVLELGRFRPYNCGTKTLKEKTLNYTDFGVKGPEELEQDEWSLHGGEDGGRPTFETPKGGNLEVIGRVKKVDRKARYVYHCSACASDPELFGDGLFLSLKLYPGDSRIPCGCSKRPDYTEDQYKLRVRRVAEPKGLSFLGWFGDYRGSKTRIELHCEKHGSWATGLETFVRRGSGCQRCGNEVMAKKLSENKTKSTELFIVQAKALHGDLYDYSKVIYTRGTNLVTIICKKHGEFQQAAANHLTTRGCPDCGRERVTQSRTYDNKVFIEMAVLVHGDKYSYDQVDYKNTHTNVRIGCKEHGLFLQTPAVHLRGGGCRKCGIIKGMLSSRSSQEDIISRFKSVHGEDRYNYDQVEYRGTTRKVKIICREHGAFFQTPASHLVNTHGCPECGKQAAAEAKTMDDSTLRNRLLPFLKGDRISFVSRTPSNKSRVILRCSEHGVFTTRWNSIVQGKGFSCPGCSVTSDQRYTYLFSFWEDGACAAAKFGKSKDAEARANQVLRVSRGLELKVVGVWKYDNHTLAKVAEEECKQKIKTGILTERDIKSGFTETFFPLDLEKVIAIYEKHGGVRIK